MKGLNCMKAGLAVLALTTLVWAVPANRQTHVVRFNIPFGFATADAVLPAGQYEVVFDQFARILVRNSNETTLHWVSLSGKSLRRSSRDLSPAKLRFGRYDGTMFLTAAWAPGCEDGETVRPSGRMAEAMRAGLGTTATEIVTVDSSME